MAKVFLLDFVLCQHPATGHLASTLADCLLLLLKGLKWQHMAGDSQPSGLNQESATACDGYGSARPYRFRKSVGN